MSEQPESNFKRLVVEALRGCNALTFKVHGHGMQAPGWPDLQVYHVRWTGQLELKVGSNSLSAAQRIVINRLVERGAPAFVLRQNSPPGRARGYEAARVSIEDAQGLVLRSMGFTDCSGPALLDALHELSQDVWSRIRSEPLTA